MPLFLLVDLHNRLTCTLPFTKLWRCSSIYDKPFELMFNHNYGTIVLCRIYVNLKNS